MNKQAYYKNIVYYGLKWLYFLFVLLMYVFFIANIEVSAGDITTYYIFLSPVLFVFVMNILQMKYATYAVVVKLKFIISIVPIVYSFLMNILLDQFAVVSNVSFIIPLLILTLCTVVYLFELKWIGYKPEVVFEEKEKTPQIKRKMSLDTVAQMMMALHALLSIIVGIFHMMVYESTTNPINGYLIVVIVWTLTFMFTVMQNLYHQMIHIIFKLMSLNTLNLIGIILFVNEPWQSSGGDIFFLMLTTVLSIGLTVTEIMIALKSSKSEVKLK